MKFEPTKEHPNSRDKIAKFDAGKAVIFSNISHSTARLSVNISSHLKGVIAMKIFSVALGLLLLSLNANAVSFVCNKASTTIENEICSDSLLGKMDSALAQNYKYMLAANIGDGAKKELKATQKEWLAVRNKCANKACLVDAYRQRVDAVCKYPVISGVHPMCTSSDEIK